MSFIYLFLGGFCICRSLSVESHTELYITPDEYIILLGCCAWLCQPSVCQVSSARALGMHQDNFVCLDLMNSKWFIVTKTEKREERCGNYIGILWKPLTS